MAGFTLPAIKLLCVGMMRKCARPQCPFVSLQKEMMGRAPRGLFCPLPNTEALQAGTR